MDLPNNILLPDELLPIWLLCFLLGKIWFIRGLAHRFETWSILFCFWRKDAVLEEGYILCPPDLAGMTREAFSSSLTLVSACWDSAFPVILVRRDWQSCLVM